MIKCLIVMCIIFSLTACASLPRRQIETVIDISAPRELVWETLIDGQAYETWNPFITKMEGEIIEGGRLRNTMMPTPGKSMTFSPRLLKVDNNRELRWLGKLYLPGLFDGGHYFKLEDSTKGTKLIHGEKFSGIALLFMDVRKFEDNFNQMNSALSKQVTSKNPQDFQ